jgi:hypothetical protein
MFAFEDAFLHRKHGAIAAKHGAEHAAHGYPGALRPQPTVERGSGTA